mmetsp:Transcript_60080/g.127277  ORF Transcript_60080/g.127277 Transcript_60080/m.127277 type:complete len:441 (+) Transcript_60080:130-1452(+)
MSAGNEREILRHATIVNENNVLREELPPDGDEEDAPETGESFSKVRSEAAALAAFRMASARAVSTRNAGLLVPKDSLYGSVIVLPQIARALGNHPTYVGKATVAWICLGLVLFMQGIFVYEVYGMVARTDKCCAADPEWCEGKGYVNGGRPSWDFTGVFPDRWYLCHLWNTGNENHQILRKLCVVAFVVCLFKDMRQTSEMANLLWELPTGPGTWMVVTPADEEVIRVDAEGHHTIHREVDHQIKWQVDSLQLHWKILTLIFVLLPKFTIFCFLYFYGSMWLLSVSDHQELITNAVALVFVLELDEAVFAAVTTSDVQQQMDNLQPWSPYKPDEFYADMAQQQMSFTEAEADASTGLLGNTQVGNKLQDVVRKLEDNYPWVQSTLTYGRTEVVYAAVRVMVFPVLLAIASWFVIGFHEMKCAQGVGGIRESPEQDFCASL